jgi:hypothetical protein
VCPAISSDSDSPKSKGILPVSIKNVIIIRGIIGKHKKNPFIKNV